MTKEEHELLLTKMCRLEKMVVYIYKHVIDSQKEKDEKIAAKLAYLVEGIPTGASLG